MRATREHTGNIGTYSLTLRTLLASCRCSISSYPVVDSCIKMGSYDSHFNVSLIMRDKVRRQCPAQTTTFKEKLKMGAEADSNRSPSVYLPNALPLGQTGSPEEEEEEDFPLA